MTSLVVPAVRGHRVKSGTNKHDTEPGLLTQAVLVVSPRHQQTQHRHPHRHHEHHQQQQQQQQQLLLRPRITSSNNRRVRRSVSVQPAHSCSIKVVGRRVSSPSLSRPETPTLTFERKVSGQGQGSVGPRQGTPRPQTAAHSLARSLGREYTLAQSRQFLSEQLQRSLLRADNDDKPLSEISSGQCMSPKEVRVEASGKRRRKSSKLSRSSSFPSAPLSINSAAVSLSSRPPSSTAQPLSTRTRPHTALASQVRTQKFDFDLTPCQNLELITKDHTDESLRKSPSQDKRDSIEAKLDISSHPTQLQIHECDNTCYNTHLCKETTNSCQEINLIRTPSLERDREVSVSSKDERALSPSVNTLPLDTYPESAGTLPVNIEHCPVYDKHLSSNGPCKDNLTSSPLEPNATDYSNLASTVALQNVDENNQAESPSVEVSKNVPKDCGRFGSSERQDTGRECLPDGNSEECPDDYISVAASSVVDSESAESSSRTDSDSAPGQNIVRSSTPARCEMKDLPSSQTDGRGLELVDRTLTYKIRYRGSHSAEGNDGSRLQRGSIAEEIRRQNQLLEERNSEVNRVGQAADKSRFEPAAAPHAERSKQASGLVTNKGDVCGSPGFSLMQDQLRATIRNGDRQVPALSHRKSGILSNSALADKGRRPLRALCSPDDGELPAVNGGTRARLQGRESVDALCVEGDAYGTESPGTGSTASSNVPSPGLARVSVQDSSLLSAAVNRAISDSKVKVSLAFLKEKQGVFSTGYRHRLSAAHDNNGSNRDSPTAYHNNNNSAMNRAEGSPNFCVQNVKSPRQGYQASPGNTPRYVYVGFEVEESGSERGDTHKQAAPSQPR
ncbi:hypothetical protein ElyMa_004622300 [Elysia marginata]|uniref:Uncharacterized protein n=1 Tax=Elysia marginata TaxID=1093978 RepID=A0AAV4HYK2_9GAST|nr:hypothetical protein ElyMa_004622300 [Elysia marginata]